MTCRKTIPSPDDLFRAEKQVLAGIYGRLLARYVMHYIEKFATSLAMAVTKTILCYPVQDEKGKVFIEQNRDQILQEIAALRDDTDIRRIVTDTLVVRTVFRQRNRGCSENSTIDPIGKIKELGIYLEGPQAPTPASFVKTAGRFFSGTPLRAPFPPLTV